MRGHVIQPLKRPQPLDLGQSGVELHLDMLGAGPVDGPLDFGPEVRILERHNIVGQAGPVNVDGRRVGQHNE
jgi:hypothetical protein